MSEIMEVRRKGFERWINNQAFNPKLDVISAWQGYNAALDSVCVELPPILCVPEDCDDPSAYDCYNYGINNCRSAIKRAGLKVKP